MERLHPGARWLFRIRAYYLLIFLGIFLFLLINGLLGSTLKTGLLGSTLKTESILIIIFLVDVFFKLVALFTVWI